MCWRCPPCKEVTNSEAFNWPISQLALGHIFGPCIVWHLWRAWSYQKTLILLLRSSAVCLTSFLPCHFRGAHIFCPWSCCGWKWMQWFSEAPISLKMMLASESDHETPYECLVMVFTIVVMSKGNILEPCTENWAWELGDDNCSWNIRRTQLKYNCSMPMFRVIYRLFMKYASNYNPQWYSI